MDFFKAKESVMRSSTKKAILITVSLAILGGCAKKAVITQKFTPNETATYKVSTESVRDYKFEQPSINQTKVQQTVNKSEVTFDKKVLSVDAQGNADQLITIKQAAFLSKSPTGTMVDVDTARDTNSPFKKLVGQSYTIKVAPDGNVLKVVEAQKALDAVKGDGMENKVAQSLLSDESIKERHSVPLPKVDQIKVGKTWSSLRGSPSGMLVPKSYNRIYTLENIKDENGKAIADVNMSAIPSSAKVDAGKETAKGLSFFQSMFDTKEKYNGKMVFDVTDGQLLKYNEKLKAEWVAAEPAEEQKSDKGPDVLTMGFTHLYSIEKIK
jgi:hypothetical protein